MVFMYHIKYVLLITLIITTIMIINCSFDINLKVSFANDKDHDAMFFNIFFLKVRFISLLCIGIYFAKICKVSKNR